MLNDTIVTKLKANPKKEILKCDGENLYIRVSPKGKKSWIYIQSQPKPLKKVIGTFPSMSTYQARIARDNLVESLKSNEPLAYTFQAAFESYVKLKRPQVTEAYITYISRIARKYLTPAFGSRPISTLKPQDILKAAKPALERGKIDRAHRIIKVASAVLRYQVAIGELERNVAEHLRQNLPKREEQHHQAMLEPQSIQTLIKRIKSIDNLAIRYLLLIDLHVFLRISELTPAQWDDIEFFDGLWFIPAERMKTRKEHIVPLSEQVISLLIKLRDAYPDTPYLFDESCKYPRPLNALLGTGYRRGEITIHGFRATASTVMHEHGIASYLIETQLSHADANNIRARYNRSKYIEKRTLLMQWWSDYLTAVEYDKPVPKPPAEIC